MIDLPTDPVQLPQRFLQAPKRSTVVIVTLFIALFFITPAVAFTAMAWRSCDGASWRILFASVAILLFALPARIAFIARRRKIRTGQWPATAEERLEMRRKWGRWGEPRWMSRSAPWLGYGTVLVWSAMALLKLRQWHTRTHAPSDLIMAALWALTAAFSLLSARVNAKKVAKQSQ
ncbi:hypothetical protein [Granulicella pectinivorans]|jgi:hypothetical protein|uniref:hypothetical protein n=1 Tax=Granulicella pectinivorans TaxID=474950 RepID=UPI000B7E6A72|nr:hypothetical protein [Granulicella pectinivorans]